MQILLNQLTRYSLSIQPSNDPAENRVYIHEALFKRNITYTGLDLQRRQRVEYT